MAGNGARTTHLAVAARAVSSAARRTATSARAASSSAARASRASALIKPSSASLRARVLQAREMRARLAGVERRARAVGGEFVVGAIQAPRWTYIEPAIVFNPTISFLTVIMALLGGANRLWGPMLGAIPLFILFEWLSANFPNHYSIILGLMFIAIVFVVPRGVLALGEDLVGRLRRKEAAQ